MHRSTLAVCCALALAAPTWAGETRRTEGAGLRFTLPAAWRRVPTLVEDRVAMYALPPAAGDAGDTEFILSVPGTGSVRKTDEILDGWYSRFTQPDGRPSREAAVLSRRSARGLAVTAVDLTGTYVGSGSPSTAGPTRAGISGYRLLGAVVESDQDGKGPWVLRIFGPAATVAAAKPDFEALLDSLEPHY